MRASTIVPLAVLMAAAACRSEPEPLAGPGVEVPARPQPRLPAPATVLEPFPGVKVLRGGSAPAAVELTGRVCLHAGWLEQIACAANTREHESLVVPQATPSQVHAALLMAGFRPGTPGWWRYDEQAGRLAFQAPTGSALEVLVRYRRPDGGEVEEPIGRLIRDHLSGRPFPEAPWVFGGSRIEAGPEGAEPGERYLADLSGSIIGLVTFGDEVVGFSKVFADLVSVTPAEWEVDSERIPPVGTEVRLILRPFEGPVTAPRRSPTAP